MMRNPQMTGCSGQLRVTVSQQPATRSTTMEVVWSPEPLGRGARAIFAVLPARFAALTGGAEPVPVPGTAFLRPGLVHGQTTALELALIQRGARRLALRGISHF